MDDIPLGALLPHIEHLLHALEDLRRHQRLMPPRIDLPLVRHHAKIVGIAEDESELTAGDRLLLPLRRAPGGEPLRTKFLLQPRQADLSAGITVEGPGHEWSSLRIHGDPVDEVAIDLLADVEVADAGATGGAPIHRLVEHLGADILPTLADLHLIHDVGDRFHRVSHVAFAELLFGRDQLDVHAGQDALGDRRISLIAKHPGTHIDDDVAHLGMLLDVAEQLPEDGTLGDRLGRVPRFDELLGDGSLEALRSLSRRLALGGDRVAIGINVDCRVQLPLRGNPQIEHGCSGAGFALVARGPGVLEA
ncbi:MAG: hypothetical protein QM589_04495 [Thermomicrobiales bacterium]